METLKEAFKSLKNLRDVGKKCREKLIKSNYIWNEPTGWEKPEILEAFGLNPNDLNEIPARYVTELDPISKDVPAKDEFGNKTGGIKQAKYYVGTGKTIKIPTVNWLAYKRWKSQYKYKLAPQTMLKAFKNYEERKNTGEFVTLDECVNMVDW